MRDTLHSLSERADEEHWSRYHRVLSEPIAYDGDVLEPDGDRAVDSIEFEFKSSPLRPTYINLPILSQSATISVSVNGQFLDRITVAASTRPLFHAFRWDVTDLTEGWTQSRLRIDIS